MHRLQETHLLPMPIDRAWAFFSNPRNLNEITPPEMRFEIQTPVPDEMYAGLMIQYRVRPLWGIPMTWVTEITHVQDRSFFVDEQRVGPYAIWHHEHHFQSAEGGTLMTDILSYKLHLGPIGTHVLEPLLVGKKVREIFAYRTERLHQLFGKSQ